MKILIIDDSTINNIFMQSILEEEGYETKSALDGYEAFRKIEEFQPDLIILDIMMPEISGFDVLEKLSHNQIFIPVIAISAYKDKKYEKRAISMGASSYLHKPIKSDDLFKTIEECKVNHH